MGEPAIGRIGYVINVPWEREEPAPNGRREVFCTGCKSWFPSEEDSCTCCGKARTGYNRWIRHAQLDRHLFGMKAQAETDKKVMARAQHGAR